MQGGAGLQREVKQNCDFFVYFTFSYKIFLCLLRHDIKTLQIKEKSAGNQQNIDQKMA